MKTPLLLVLFSLFSITVFAGEFDDCDEELKRELIELIRKDKSKILSKQFKITTLKMVQKTKLADKTTIESLIRSNQRSINKLDLKSPEVLQGLQSLYSNNSKESTKEVLQHINRLKEKSKGTSYWKASKRLMNDDVSSYLLFDNLTNKKSNITKLDIAITWYMKKVSEQSAIDNGRYSAKYNLTNLSNQLTRYTGVINGAKDASLKEIDADLERLSSELEMFLKNAALYIKKNLEHCLSEDGKWKGICKFDNKLITSEVENLLLEVSDIEKEFYGSIANNVREDTVKNSSTYKIKTRPDHQEKNDGKNEALKHEAKNEIVKDEKVQESLEASDSVQNFESNPHISKVLIDNNIDVNQKVEDISVNNYDDYNYLKNYVDFKTNGRPLTGNGYKYTNLYLHDKKHGFGSIKSEYLKVKDKDFINDSLEKDISDEVDRIFSANPMSGKIKVNCSSTQEITFFKVKFYDNADFATESALELLSEGEDENDYVPVEIYEDGKSTPKTFGNILTSWEEIKKCTKAFLLKRCDSKPYKDNKCNNL